MKQIARTAKQIGAVVRRERRKRELTQAALGSKIGLRQATVSKLEKGEPATQLRTVLDALTALDLQIVIACVAVECVPVQCDRAVERERAASLIACNPVETPSLGAIAGAFEVNSEGLRISLAVCLQSDGQAAMVIGQRVWVQQSDDRAPNSVVIHLEVVRVPRAGGPNEMTGAQGLEGDSLLVAELSGAPRDILG